MERAAPPSAYQGAAYARSLAEFGEPRELPLSGGWYLRRPIAGAPLHDAMGCYPHLFCRDWRGLAADLEAIGSDLVSFAAVPDPFGDFDRSDLERAFPDRLIHFKDHFVADLSRPLDVIITASHRRRAEKALRELEVSFEEQPLGRLDEWQHLFAGVVERFAIKGIPAFSPEAFAAQFSIPGVVLSLARHHGEVVAAHVQFQSGDAVYAHVAAGSEAGRRLGADFALYYAEIHHYRDRARWIDWGGHAGARDAADDGLARFKAGWSTDRRPVYFGGRILDPAGYEALSRSTGHSGQAYFPCYRYGEFS